MGQWVLRALFVLILAATSYYFRPFALPAVPHALILGCVLAAAIVVFELCVRRLTLKTLVGAAIGSIAGILGASLISLVLSRMTFFDSPSATFLQILILAFMTYVGLILGVAKGELLSLEEFLGGGDGKKITKILDTSVIIDGRVCDIIETGFLEGQILVPEFVLRELQLVADSADSIKRNRGRRGLDILQKIQKNTTIDSKIVEMDFPEIREVDMKLIELARRTGAKIVTNDFNLNKVAQLRGVEVLNINELANAIKPVVLPGESMRVFILKEGKEYNQGVAYLDDGTMVVVDNARKMIGKTVDVLVTSVLQTTAGKMIFGKFAEHPDNRVEFDRDRLHSQM
ncbi:MAG: TRAM domain-containing protein [Acidobacteria bacterium]|nr:TRAM domain-containing protein [Acidobacteriota bacterium]